MPTEAEATRRPTAFLLHALGAGAREFDSVGALLAPDFDVVALDLPGFGDAAHGDAGEFDVAGMAASVVRAIAAHEPGRWILVGHSMGGKVASVVAAQTLAGETPLFGLAGVVLLAASPPSPEPMDEERRASMLSWVQDGSGQDESGSGSGLQRIGAEESREFVDANVGAPLPAEADALMIELLRRASPEAWRAWLETGSREDWSARVGVLDLPALIIAGGADGDLGEEAQRRLNGAVYPRATVRVLEGAGHLLPLERPREVAAEITAFWQQRAGLGPAVPDASARLLASFRTSVRSRGILARRAVADDPAYRPAALTPEQLTTLRAVAARVVPQDGPPIDLAARVDAQLAAGQGDGWRLATLPPDRVAYARALTTLAAHPAFAPPVPTTPMPAARRAPSAPGPADAAAQDAVLSSVADGTFEPPAGLDAGATLSPEQLAGWFEDATVDLVRQWVAHPATMARIDFDGFADGYAHDPAATPAPAGDPTPSTAVPVIDPADLTRRIRRQGFELLAADEREPWEPLA